MYFPALCQIADVQVQVSQNTEALQGAQMEISDLTRQLQTLEIELASQQGLVSKHFCLVHCAYACLNLMWGFYFPPPPINPVTESLFRGHVA